MRNLKLFLKFLDFDVFLTDVIWNTTNIGFLTELTQMSRFDMFMNCFSSFPFFVFRNFLVLFSLEKKKKTQIAVPNKPRELGSVVHYTNLELFRLRVIQINL